jgi:hypothetical protein
LRPVGSKANEDTPSLILLRPIGSKPKVRGTPVQARWMSPCGNPPCIRVRMMI